MSRSTMTRAFATLVVTLAAVLAGSAEAFAQEHPGYRRGTATIDGTGKYYMGREISLVMGHRGAGWLERPTREREERTDLLIEYLHGLDARIVADIGVGTGYFAIPWAQSIPDGRVLGVDIQQEMLDLLGQAAAAAEVTNIEPVLGAIDDPRLPPGEVDVVLIVDAYHEFSHPFEMTRGIYEGLRPGGRLVLVEYRGEDPRVPIKPLHKMTAERAILEVEAAGLSWVETLDFLPQQHILVFERPTNDGGGR